MKFVVTMFVITSLLAIELRADIIIDGVVYPVSNTLDSGSSSGGNLVPYQPPTPMGSKHQDNVYIQKIIAQYVGRIADLLDQAKIKKLTIAEARDLAERAQSVHQTAITELGRIGATANSNFWSVLRRPGLMVPAYLLGAAVATPRLADFLSLYQQPGRAEYLFAGFMASVIAAVVWVAHYGIFDAPSGVLTNLERNRSAMLVLKDLQKGLQERGYKVPIRATLKHYKKVVQRICGLDLDF